MCDTKIKTFNFFHFLSFSVMRRFNSCFMWHCTTSIQKSWSTFFLKWFISISLVFSVWIRYEFMRFTNNCILLITTFLEVVSLHQWGTVLLLLRLLHYLLMRDRCVKKTGSRRFDCYMGHILIPGIFYNQTIFSFCFVYIVMTRLCIDWSQDVTEKMGKEIIKVIGFWKEEAKKKRNSSRK